MRISSQIYSILYFLILLLGPINSHAAEPVQETLSIAQILDNMNAAYANARSYQDSGMILTKFPFLPNEKKQFTTVFLRPDRFRFEYQKINGLMDSDDDERYIVWQNGTETKSAWTLNDRIKNETSLGMAVAGATGVSSGSAYTIPALLIPKEIGGRMLTKEQIKDATLKETYGSDQPDCDCYHIQGTFAGDPITLWIDKTHFMIRKIHQKHSKTATDEITTYNPILNETIPEDALTFRPPKAKDKFHVLLAILAIISALRFGIPWIRKRPIIIKNNITLVAIISVIVFNLAGLDKIFILLLLIPDIWVTLTKTDRYCIYGIDLTTLGNAIRHTLDEKGWSYEEMTDKFYIPELSMTIELYFRHINGVISSRQTKKLKEVMDNIAATFDQYPPITDTRAIRLQFLKDIGVLLTIYVLVMQLPNFWGN